MSAQEPGLSGLSQEEKTQRFYDHVWPHRAVVLRTARFLAGNAAAADDLAQETLMRAFHKIDQLDTTSNPKAWLTAILRHTRIDQLRLRAPTLLDHARDLDALPLHAPPETRPADPADWRDLLEELSDQHLIDALVQLPEEIRWSLLLIDVEQMSYEDAGAIMSVPAGTAKSRVHRGRQMLRTQLSSGDTSSTPKREETP